MKNAHRCAAIVGTGLMVLAGPLTAQQAGNPFEAFKSALKKALPSAIAAAPAPPAGQANPRADRPAASAGSTEPFRMDDSQNDQPAAAVKLGDYKNMPSVVGINLSMPLQDALGALRAQYKGAVQLGVPLAYSGYDQRVLLEFGVGINVVGAPPEAIHVEATSPPQEQRIWRVNRRAGDYNHPTLRGPLLASLRQKYGKETVAFSGSGIDGADSALISQTDAEISLLWWLFDEQGRPARLPPGGVEELRGNACLGQFLDVPRSQAVLSTEGITKQTYCNTSLVIVRADIGLDERVGAFYVDMLDIPIVSRAARATVAMQRDAAMNQQKAELKKAEQNKPVL
jgi:hypothetical protein